MDNLQEANVGRRYCQLMRWDNLFDDLEGQLEHELALEEADLRAEEERMRIGRQTMRDRLAAVSGTIGGGLPLTIALCGGDRIRVTVSTLGRDWVAGELVQEAALAGRTRQCVIPTAAIAYLALERSALTLSQQAPATQRALSERLGLNFVLRDLSRRRCQVEIWQSTERVHGTIDRVGRDHFDLAVHEAGSARREHMVTSVRLIPFSDIRLVQMT